MAGPIKFGPIISGEGSVGKWNLPHLIDPSDIKDPEENQRFIVELAGFVHETIDTLVSTHLSRMPHPSLVSNVMGEILEINFIIITDSMDVGNSRSIDTSILENLVSQIPMLNKKKIGYRTTRISIHDSVAASSLYYHSLRHSIMVSSGKSSFDTQTHSFLDSSEIHLWANHFLSKLITSNKNPQFIFPVVIFDLFERGALLLDKLYQVLTLIFPLLSFTFKKTSLFHFLIWLLQW